MTTQTISAGANPEMANDLINKALAETTQPEKKELKIKIPSENLVTLPGGFIDSDGGVINTVEVRELTGKDEEAIAKATTVGRLLNTVLSRGTVKVGELPVTEEILNTMLAGDREAVLIGIHQATFGNPVEVNGYCRGCDDTKTVAVDLTADLEMKTLSDPITERTFKVQGRKDEYTVILPNGIAQKELQSNLDKTVAELSTILLQNTITEINGEIVYSKSAIQNMGVVDRRKVSEEIMKRNPGPIFEDLEVTCPDCEGMVVVPINLGSLFQF